VRRAVQQATNTTNEVSGRVYSSGLPYTCIQESGGQIKAHIIEAKNGKAPAFRWHGKEVFFKRINHPGSNIKGTRWFTNELWDERYCG
jgi:hypothetical protein